MTDRQDKERTINLLIDLLKLIFNVEDLEITVEQAQRVSMINLELKKLGLDLPERLK